MPPQLLLILLSEYKIMKERIQSKGDSSIKVEDVTKKYYLQLEFCYLKTISEEKFNIGNEKEII